MNTKNTSSSEPENSEIEDTEEASMTDDSLDSEIDLESGEDTEVEGRDPVDVLKEELTEQRNEFLRYQAETENFKKRMRKEKEDFSRFANEKLLKELILIKDNLERALSAPNATIESLKEGLDMILKQFDSFMEKENVESIAAVGEKFDPAVHEVLCQVDSEEHEDNTVTEEYSKGYHLNGRILRPAKVVVSKRPEKDGAKTSSKEKEEDGETDS